MCVSDPRPPAPGSLAHGASSLFRKHSPLRNLSSWGPCRAGRPLLVPCQGPAVLGILCVAPEAPALGAWRPGALVRELYLQNVSRMPSASWRASGVTRTWPCAPSWPCYTPTNAARPSVSAAVLGQAWPGRGSKAPTPQPQSLKGCQNRCVRTAAPLPCGPLEWELAESIPGREGSSRGDSHLCLAKILSGNPGHCRPSCH